jgi:plastocyanin
MSIIRKGFLVTLLFSSFVVIVFLLSFQGTAAAEKAVSKEKVTTITLKQEPAGISPNPLKVKLGTTIVWFNSDPGPITVKFLDKLGIACKVPVNFYADIWGNYETAAIPQAGTASICFIYKGTYKYEVKRLMKEGEAAKEEISTGTIIAEE